MDTPRDFTLRPARPEDHARIAELFLELAVDDPPPSPERFEQRMRASTLVAEQQGRVVGYAFTDTLEDIGYIRHVVADASVRRQGVGRALLLEWARRFREAGCTQWCLNVKPDNVPARQLYESLGMRPAFRSCALRLPWELLSGVPAGPVWVEPVDSQERARELEQALALPAGLLSHKRTQSGLVVLGAWEAGAPVGVACYDTGFPGAYPFRARDLAVTRALVECCATHALPGTPYMQLVMENQEALARQLQEAGASLRLDVLHYQGPLGQPHGP